jgi:prepilin-type processing-associated H-X9-DG protein
MVMYCNDNSGYMFPVGVKPAGAQYPVTLGTNVMPHLRWPVILFEIALPSPLGYTDDPIAYRTSENAIHDDASQMKHMADYDARPFSTKYMLCPSDVEPYEAHSYVINQQLVQQDNPVRFSGGDKGGKTVSDIIVAGEKRTTVRDYHMERGDKKPAPDINGIQYETDFDRVVEPYRHGLSLGSNYVFLDGHVDTVMPEPALKGVDPWTVSLPADPTAPNPPPTP